MPKVGKGENVTLTVLVRMRTIYILNTNRRNKKQRENKYSLESRKNMDLLPVENDCVYGKTTEGKAPSIIKLAVFYC